MLGPQSASTPVPKHFHLAGRCNRGRRHKARFPEADRDGAGHRGFDDISALAVHAIFCLYQKSASKVRKN